MSGGFERRDFLKVLGVTGAGAAVTGCSTPCRVERLIPYVTPPEEITPGGGDLVRVDLRRMPERLRNPGAGPGRAGR